MTTDFNPKECPIGITNKKDLDFFGEKLNMAIEALTERVEDMRRDLTSQMTSGFSRVDEKLEDVNSRLSERVDNLDKNISEKVTSLDARLDRLKEDADKKEEELNSKIDQRLEEKKGNLSFSLVRWVFVTLGGSVLITILGNLLLKVFHII